MSTPNAITLQFVRKIDLLWETKTAIGNFFQAQYLKQGNVNHTFLAKTLAIQQEISRAVIPADVDPTPVSPNGMLAFKRMTLGYNPAHSGIDVDLETYDNPRASHLSVTTSTQNPGIFRVKFPPTAASKASSIDIRLPSPLAVAMGLDAGFEFSPGNCITKHIVIEAIVIESKVDFNNDGDYRDIRFFVSQTIQPDWRMKTGLSYGSYSRHTTFYLLELNR